MRRIRPAFSTAARALGRARRRGKTFGVASLTNLRYFYIFGIVETKDAVAAMSALAQDTRLDLFRLLVQQGPAGLPAGRVAERLGIPPATLSFHLSQLRHAGLLVSRRDGRQIVYAADYARMSALLSYLTENCCRSGASSCAPPSGANAEKERRSRRGTNRQSGHRT